MAKIQRDRFTFFQSFADAAGTLDGAARLEFYEAIINYALYGTEPKLSNSPSRGMFALVRPVLDRGRTNFNNGNKGGAPEGNNNRNSTEKKTRNNRETTENQPSPSLGIGIGIGIGAGKGIKEDGNGIGKGNRSGSVIPPACEEVVSYFVEELKASKDDAQSFCDHYDSCGWVVGKDKKMKDWKASARGWMRRKREGFNKGGVSVAIPDDDHTQGEDIFSQP